MKRFSMLFLTIIIVTISTPTLASNSVNGIILNGQQLEMDVNPVIIEGRTLVPARALFEALGLDVSWNPIERIIRAEKPGHHIEIALDDHWDNRNRYNRVHFINEEVHAKIINGRTLIPVRFVAETLGLDVEWNNNTRNVVIKEKSQKPVLNIEQAYEILIEEFGYSSTDDFVYMPFGAYAKLDKHVLDNYYIFAVKFIVDEGPEGGGITEYYADHNMCVHKNTGEIRYYAPW